MITAHRFAVSWCYRERNKTIRRILYNYEAEPCIEAARLISGNPYAFEVEVRNVDTGREVSWGPEWIGQVLCRADIVGNLEKCGRQA